jgi:hypothetical protein
MCPLQFVGNSCAVSVNKPISGAGSSEACETGGRACNVSSTSTILVSHLLQDRHLLLRAACYSSLASRLTDSEVESWTEDLISAVHIVASVCSHLLWWFPYVCCERQFQNWAWDGVWFICLWAFDRLHEISLVGLLCPDSAATLSLARRNHPCS